MDHGPSRLPSFLYRPLKRLYDNYRDRFVSPWLILAFDLLVIFITFYVAFAIRLNFEMVRVDVVQQTPQAILVTLVYTLSFLYFRPFSGIIRHTGLNDAFRVLQATGTAFIFMLVFGGVTRLLNADLPWTTSFAVYLIHFLLAYFVLIGARVVVKTVFSEVGRARHEKGRRVIIFGAGSSGVLARNALVNDPGTIYDMVAFADDNPGKVNKLLEGVPVMLPEKALDEGFVRRTRADLLIISIQNLHPRRRAEIIEKALELDLEVKVVPPLDRWVHGQLSSAQLQKVRIEDLMEREQIVLDSANVAADISGKVVMVTGAAGSIGGEIARQALSFGPDRLILVDQAESALYDLQYEIGSDNQLKGLSDRLEYVVANVKDHHRMKQLFDRHHPQIIYHAAAYKHVPLMESFPYEALLTNVFGTKTVADLAIQYKTEKFVMVSTDKAVNPTNVMGASKRIAEIYTQCLSNDHTQFITTRFGNVLDSNGSVIPLFRRQIERGGPVTVTHREITRFFMMISEACNLVLEAGAMGKGGEIFLFDMGKPVKIIDLARKMIQLSGLEPDEDIMIREIGLRPGEKLYEEVLATEENTLPTYHPKILHARVRSKDKETVRRQLEELFQLISRGDDFTLVRKMKEMVPEYRSENSVYSTLD
ncbi:MAG: polysaccharide biosynthesis protein [Bacteroidales bacterium]